MTDRELMQQALNALSVAVKNGSSAWSKNANATAEAIRARLAQPEPPCKTGSQCVGGKCERCAVQKPVAWRVVNVDGRVSHVSRSKEVAETWLQYDKTRQVEPLYTAPPQRTWVGLTDDDINDHWITAMWNTEGTRLPIPEFARAIEAKLKEKNT